MSIFRILTYLFGQVTMVVKGRTVEKFINMASTRGVRFWDVKRLDDETIEVRTTLSAVKSLRHVARRTGSRFHVTGRDGLPFVMRQATRRKQLVIGALVFMAGLYMLSSFVWFLDVEGCKTVDRTKILSAARQAGVYQGVPKWAFETHDIEDAILERIPELAWVGVDMKGTRLIISVSEKKLPMPQTAYNRTNVVARKAGLIQEVLVLQGQAVAKDGQTVVPGQLLISGEVWPEEVLDETGAVLPREPKYVQAKGIVRARVWYEAYEEVPLIEQGMRATGVVTKAWSIKIGQRQINIKGPDKPPYKDYEQTVTVRRGPHWRSLDVPVEVVTTVYKELKPFKHVRSKDEALAAARDQVLTAIKSKMPEDYKILDQRVEVVQTGRSEDLIRVHARVESLEDIGVEQAIK